MRGYLRCQESMITLAPKITTVGSQNCDIVIEGLDSQHAIIECNEAEQCYILQDLDTSSGTYVNDCRIRNATVRLANGDAIQFGNNHSVYVLEYSARQISPVRHAAWNGNLTVIDQMQPSYAAGYFQSQFTPHIQIPLTPGQIIGPQLGPSTVSAGRPVSIRQRPLSAGARNRPLDRPQMSPVATLPNRPQQRPGSTWSSRGGRSRTGTSTSRVSFDDSHVSVVEEKDQRIFELNTEISRLMSVEATRDAEIQRLRLDHQVQAAAASGGPALQAASQNMEDFKRLQDIIKQKDELLMKAPKPEQLEQLESDLQRVRDELSVASGLLSKLRKEAAHKDAANTRLTRELEMARQELGSKQTELVASRERARKLEEMKEAMEDLKKKDNEISTLKQEITKLSETIEDLTSAELRLKEQLEVKASEVSNANQTLDSASSALEETRGQLTKAQSTERQAQLDLQQSTARLDLFRSRLVQLMSSVPGYTAEDEDPNDDDVVSGFKNISNELKEVKEKLSEFEKIQSEAKVLSETKEKENEELVEHLKKLKEFLEESQGRISGKPRRCKELREEMAKLSAIQLNSTVQFVRQFIVTSMGQEVQSLKEIDEAITAAGMKSDDETYGSAVKALQTQMQTLKWAHEEAGKKLIQMGKDHKEEIKKAVNEAKSELESDIKAAVAEETSKGEERLKEAVDQVKSSMKSDMNKEIDKEKNKASKLQANVEKLEQDLAAVKSENDCFREEREKSTIDEEKIKQVEEEARVKIASIQEEMEALKQNYELKLVEAGEAKQMATVDLHNQVQEHAVTICELRDQVSSIEKEKKETRVELASCQNQLAAERARQPQVPKPPAPPKPAGLMQRAPPADVIRLQHTIAQLKEENITHMNHIHEQDELIVSLRHDLEGADARLSDIRGEMSEAQKQEIEGYLSQISERDTRLIDTQKQLAQLSELVDKMRDEHSETNEQLKKVTSQLGRYKQKHAEKDKRVKSLEQSLTEEREKIEKAKKEASEELRMKEEMSEQGCLCRGERHEQTISRQKEALAELRSRLRLVEQTTPASSSSNGVEALQEIAMLRRELAEIKAQNALMADPATRMLIARTGGPSPPPPRQLALTSSDSSNVVRGSTEVGESKIERELERSAHRNTAHALDHSEKTYLSLMRCMAEAVGMPLANGMLDSLAHAQPEDRSRITESRERYVRELVARIQSLSERLQRKDELLQGYEQDLAKLRQAEELSQRRNEQLQQISQDARSKAEEANYLRESLNRTRVKLDEEKRLNTAIKQKKPYYTENGTTNTRERKKYHCPPSDIGAKQAAMKLKEQEELRRKSYAIKTLKQELAEKEELLHTAEVKLDTIMHTSVIKDPSPSEEASVTPEEVAA